MEKRKAAIIHRELNLIAKELQAAEEKSSFRKLDWKGQYEAIRKARKEVGLPEGTRLTDDVTVYAMPPSFYEKETYDVEISINWSSKGDKSFQDARKFANDLEDALKKAKKLADVLKRNFPDIKLKGI